MTKAQTAMREVLPWVESDEDLPKFILADVTNRDGLQALGWWNYWDKEARADLVKSMVRTGIHHIEVGFPALEEDPEHEAVKHVADQMGRADAVIMGLARLVEGDISNTIKALDGAQYSGVHTFIGTSPQHIEAIGMSQSKMVDNAEKFCQQIRDSGAIAQFSAEDATRTEVPFLMDMYRAAISGGAQIINIPDTLGFADPDQYCELLTKLRREFPDKVISTHAHNDKSQAEMNALIPLTRGLAQRVEGTIYGIGERAGNTDLAALIPIILNGYPDLAANLLKNSANFRVMLDKMTEVSGLHGRPVMPGYGFEALLNRSGIHQAKVAKLKSSYIWNQGADLGTDDRPYFDITPLSGNQGVAAKLEEMGISVTAGQAKFMAKLFRQMFSPDTTPSSIRKAIPELPEGFGDFLYRQGQEITNIRKEARTLANSPENTQRWMQASEDIMKATYRELGNFIDRPELT